jgi:hypothetical protein
MREALKRHHASPEALNRANELRDAIERLGFKAQQAQITPYPTSPTTRKGNVAEVLLAEYICATCGVELPVFRLRYNPNINQSMKGDDVLAFDLDANPVRLVVGEAKFRSHATAAAVRGITGALSRSHFAGVPISLQFVADRLFESGRAELGERVLACAFLMAQGRLRIDYIGLLLGDVGSADRVNHHPEDTIQNLAMISAEFQNPAGLAELCYRDLE